MVGAMRKSMAEKPAEVDPRAALKAATQEARGVCRQRFDAFGCAGMAPRSRPLALEAMGRRCV
jgi:fructose-bisphosphate aldolase, class II